MTGDDLKETTSNLMHALAASEADISHISAEKAADGVEVSFNLLDEDDIELVRELADEHGFERRTDGTSRFVLYREHVD